MYVQSLHPTLTPRHELHVLWPLGRHDQWFYIRTAAAIIFQTPGPGIRTSLGTSVQVSGCPLMATASTSCNPVRERGGGKGSKAVRCNLAGGVRRIPRRMA
jgi:hypothetical protein